MGVNLSSYERKIKREHKNELENIMTGKVDVAGYDKLYIIW